MRISVEIGNFRNPEANEPCEVEFWCDREGLDYLIKHLQKLDESGDHMHLMTPSWGMDDLSEEKENESSCIAHHVKVSLL